MKNKLFHTPDEMPEKGKAILLHLQDNSYAFFNTKVFTEDVIKMEYVLSHNFEKSGKVIRWCYISDLNKIE